MYNIPLKIYTVQSALYRNKIQRYELDTANEILTVQIRSDTALED